MTLCLSIQVRLGMFTIGFSYAIGNQCWLAYGMTICSPYLLWNPQRPLPFPIHLIIAIDNSRYRLIHHAVLVNDRVDLAQVGIDFSKRLL